MKVEKHDNSLVIVPETEIDDVIRLIPPQKSLEDTYASGYNCGKNGANTNNCHFALFSSPEKTKEWERGKKDAEEEKIMSKMENQRETSEWTDYIELE